MMRSHQHLSNETHPHMNDDPVGDRFSQLRHNHGAMDRVFLRSSRGIWATKVSLSVLLVTATMQVVIVVLTGSVALLADTIHNFGDAATALPLWAAFNWPAEDPPAGLPMG